MAFTIVFTFAKIHLVAPAPPVADHPSAAAVTVDIVAAAEHSGCGTFLRHHDDEQQLAVSVSMSV